MKKTTPLLRIDRLLLAALALLLAPHAQAQLTNTNWIYNFGTNTGTFSSGTSTTFLPNTQDGGGTDFVRVGTGGGSFTMTNVSGFGSGSALVAVAPTTSSINKFSVYDWSSATTSFSMSFDMRLTGGSSGVWNMFVGNGATFSNANTFSGTDSFLGMRMGFGASGAIAISNRAAGTWAAVSGTGISQSNNYTISLFGNNASASTNYYYNGSTLSLASGTWDLWVGSTRVATNLAKAQLATSSNIDSFMFYGESSTGNVATISLDNFIYFNGLNQEPPPPAGDNLYWTANGSTLGGTGTWDTTGTTWSASDASVSGAVWDSAKTAVFTNSADVVTVVTVSANAGIRFSTTGYALTNGTITLGGAAIASNAITTDASVSATINSKLSGSTGMTKAGAGTLTLSGANDYTGGTLVSAGTLIGNTTSLTGNITNSSGATLVFDQSTDGTYSGAISGAGTFVKTNNGALTLSGANTYSGGTLVAAGTLIGNTTSLTGNITNKAVVVFDQSSSATYSGVLSDTGSLIKSNTGVLTLTGANTQSGGTVIEGGALSIGAGSTLGSLAGPITNNATLLYNRSDNLTQATVISGSGALNKAGAGTLTLSQANSYAGATTISNGAVRISNATGLGSTAAGTTVVSGAALELTGGLTIGAESLTLNGTGINSGGALRNISGANSFGGAITLGSASSIASDTGGTLTLTGDINAANFLITFTGASNSVVSGAITNSSQGLTKTGAGTVTLSGANNYSGATTISAGALTVGANNSLPTGTAVTVGTSGASANGGRFNINNGLSQSIGSLTLLGGNTSSNNSGQVSIGTGSTLVVNGTIAYETGANNRFPSGISGGTLDLGGSTRTFAIFDNANTGGDLLVSSIIANGGINKTESGILSLTAANTMAGTVTVSAGTLALGNANALQNATLDTGVSSTQLVTFSVVGNTTYNIGALQGADALAIGGNTISVGANNASTTFSGAISGTGGGFTKVGTGTITLSGANSFTGPTAINAGAVRATIAGALGGTATNTVVASGAALELSGGFSLNAEPITISGTGIGNGGAIRNISGANTNTGFITLAANSRINSDAGTLLVNVTGADANAITGSFNLSLGGSGNLDFRDRIAIGTGVLTKDGSGTLTLISAASHSGGTTLSSGTIQLGATENNALGTGTVTLNGGILSGNNTVTRTLTNDVTIGGDMTFGDGSSTAAITLSGPISLGAVNRTLTIQNANTTFSGAVGGSGASITKNGSGTLTLSSSNSFTGGATVNGGILRLANTGAAGSGSITQMDGTSQIEIDVAGTITNDMNAYVIDFLQNANLSGSITMNGTVIDVGTINGTTNLSATVSGLLIGSGGMTKTGLGTLTLSAGNSYSGATTVSGGRLVVNGSQSSSAVTVNSGASLAGTGTVGALTVSGLLAPGNSIGTLSAGSTIFNTNGTFELEISDFSGAAGTAWDLLAITGDLTLSNTDVNPFTINLVSMTNGTTPGFANFNPNLNYTNTFVTYSGSLLGTTFNTNLFSISTTSFSNAITLNGAFSITNVSGGLALLYSTFFVPASDYTWTAGSGLWSDQASWTNNTEPGENGAIIFAGAGGNSTNDLVTSTANLVFSNTAGSYTLSGNAITNGVLGVVNNSANAQTINNDIILGGAQTFDAAAGDLSFGGGIDNAGFLLTVSGASNVVINGSISNTGGISMAGAGSLTLGGNNSFSGTLAANAGTVLVTGTQATAAINVAGGTLLLGTNNVLSDSTALTFSTGTVNFGGFSDTISTFNQSGGVFTNGTLTATTYGLSGGTVGGTLGAGTASVTGSVSLSGEINSTLNINSGGTLTLGSADRIGNSSAVTVNAGTLATVTFSDTVGSLVLTNGGSLTGTGTITAETYTLNGGTVGANLGAGTATSSASTTALNGTLDGDLAVSGGTVNLGSGDRIGGASAVTVSSGTLGISTFNDTVGSFTITGGTLGGTTGTLTAGTYALQGGTLTANLGAGTATVTTGTTALNGTLGATTVNINSGTLNLGSANRLSDSASVTLNGGTLGISTLTDTVGSFTIAGGTLGGTSGTLTASTYALNGGTLTANLGAGSATASSGTTSLNGTLAATTLSINGGTVNLGSADRLANTAAITLSSGTLGMSTFNDTVGSLVLSGGTLGGTTGTLTAATYDLQSGTINARLGAGAVTVSNGTTTLGSTARLNSASTLAVNGGELTLGGAETVSTYTQTGGTLGGVGQTLTAASYALQGGTVSASLGSGTATVSSGTTAINGNLGGALTASSGTANLNGTVAGNVTVSGATVNLGSANRIGDSSSVTVNSGSLSLSGDDTVGAVSLTGGTIGGSGTLTGSSYALQAGTIATAIGGSGAMTKTGAGTATLSANNSATFSGAVAVNGGAVLATTSGALGTGAVAVTDGSTLAANGVTLANSFNIGTAAVFSTNLATLRVGDGAVALSNSGGAISLLQMTTSGSVLQTINISTNSLQIGGTATTEGQLSVSPDGSTFTIAGYVPPFTGSAALSSRTSVQAPRGYVTVSSNGSVSSSTILTDLYSAAAPRSGVTEDGSVFWFAGGGTAPGSGIMAVSGSGTNQIAGVNSRVIKIYNDNLYYSTGAGVQGIYRIAGTPTSSNSAPVSILTGVTGQGANPIDFVLSPDGNTLYVADASIGVQKFAYNGTAWSLAYNITNSLTSGDRALGLEVLFGATNLILWTSATNVWSALDSGAATNGTSVYATGTVNYALRGLESWVTSTAAAGSGTLGISEAGTATFTGAITNNNIATLTAANGGLATFSGAISGAGSVTKTGEGTVTLSGANTYSGGTTLSNGVLRLTSATGAGTGTITQSSSTTLEIDTPGTITNNMSVYNVAFLDGATLSGTITVNNATFDVVENETSTISGAVEGSGGVTKTGLGQLTLSGNNTFSGATAVNAGVLELASTVGGAAASTSSVSVASGATLLISQSNQVNNSASVSLSGGTITRGGGVSEVFGNLNITQASFLDFGTGATGNLTFGTYQNNETPSALLTLNNFIPGNSFTFTSTSFSTNSVGSYFSFGTGYVNSSITNTGSTFTITAIPEPSTYLAAAGLLGLMLWPSRKRLIKDAKKILGLRAPMRDRLAAKRA